MKLYQKSIAGVIGLGICSVAPPALAQVPLACLGLPSQAALKSALVSAVAAKNGGLVFNMWGTLVAMTVRCAPSHSPEKSTPTSGSSAGLFPRRKPIRRTASA